MLIRFITLFTFFLLAVACTNPFTTRADQVETPVVQGNDYSYDPALNYEIVFTNLKKALNQKNIEEYMRCLIPEQPQDVHSFFFDAEAHFKNEFDTRPWLLSDEREYLTQLINSGKNNFPMIAFSMADSALSFRPITPTSVNDSVETNTVKYQLLITFDVDSVQLFQGLCRFKLFRLPTPPETWHIYYWQDLSIDNKYNQSWTFLKLFFRKS